jgi:hypothetical protein
MPEITIELEDPANIPLVQVPEIVATIWGGDPVSRQAVYQWVNDGRKAKTGKVVRLRTKSVRGRQCTCLDWLREFVDAL